jgi:hypothetical protein
MKVTDVKKGHFVFTPRPDRPVAWKEMHEGIVKAGYDIEATSIEVRGALTAEGRLQASGTGQMFVLSGPRLAELRREVPAGAPVTLTGPWRQGSAGESSIEVERWQVEK